MNAYSVWETYPDSTPVNIEDELYVYASCLKNAVKQVYQDRKMSYPKEFTTPIPLENGNKICVRFSHKLK